MASFSIRDPVRANRNLTSSPCNVGTWWRVFTPSHHRDILIFNNLTKVSSLLPLRQRIQRNPIPLLVPTYFNSQSESAYRFHKLPSDYRKLWSPDLSFHFEGNVNFLSIYFFNLFVFFAVSDCVQKRKCADRTAVLRQSRYRRGSRRRHLDYGHVPARS